MAEEEAVEAAVFIPLSALTSGNDWACKEPLVADNNGAGRLSTLASRLGCIGVKALFSLILKGDPDPLLDLTTVTGADNLTGTVSSDKRRSSKLDRC